MPHYHCLHFFFQWHICILLIFYRAWQKTYVWLRGDSFRLLPHWVDCFNKIRKLFFVGGGTWQCRYHIAYLDNKSESEGRGWARGEETWTESTFCNDLLLWYWPIAWVEQQLLNDGRLDIHDNEAIPLLQALIKAMATIWVWLVRPHGGVSALPRTDRNQWQLGFARSWPFWGTRVLSFRQNKLEFRFEFLILPPLIVKPFNLGQKILLHHGVVILIHRPLVTYTGSNKKNPAKFGDTCSVRANGLCIGCLGQWAERGREN